MKFILSTALLFFMMQATTAQNRTISGVTFPPKLNVKGNALFFNGCGLREKYTLDLYVAGLYLEKTTMDASLVIDANASSAIKIVITSSKVTRDKFNESVKEGFANTAKGKASAKDISKFKSFFSDAFNINDEILMIYVPGKGLAVTINRKFKGLVEGIEFKKALYAIWLGDKPASSKLKKGMLGKL
ncbi:MAG: chalcone isomerase family protein [Crocinitomicaceae bacterium]